MEGAWEALRNLWEALESPWAVSGDPRKPLEAWDKVGKRLEALGWFRATLSASVGSLGKSKNAPLASPKMPWEGLGGKPCVSTIFWQGGL